MKKIIISITLLLTFIFCSDNINDKSLNITRNGNISMKFKFILNKKTHGLYGLMGNIYHFDIETTSINITKDNINLIYKMKDNINKLSNHKINIHFNI